jgi:methionyl-tRNA formyltransferase
MRVLFWGTPDFALPTLRALLGEGHDVVGVVTQPDRPAGRGRELRPSPVKLLAQDEQLTVLQPERHAATAFIDAIRASDPEISVVVAYGQILRREVLDMPARGSINVHASLLPELRGAAPINWAIKLGHEHTGITIMRMVERMDAGPILHQVAEPIGRRRPVGPVVAAQRARCRRAHRGAHAARSRRDRGAAAGRGAGDVRAAADPRLGARRLA